MNQLNLFDDPLPVDSRDENAKQPRQLPGAPEKPKTEIPPMYRLSRAEREKVTEVPPGLQSGNTKPCFFVIRGLVFKQQGFTTLARQDFEKALSLNPGEHVAAWNLAMIHYDKDDPDRALHYLTTAYQGLGAAVEKPAPGRRNEVREIRQVVAFYIALIHARKGDLVRLSQYLLESLGTTPQGHTGRLLHIVALYKEQKDKEAGEILENMLKQYNPDASDQRTAMMTVQHYARQHVK